MGLDQYIYRISKPNLAEKTFTLEELSSMNISRVSVKNAEKHASFFKQLMPYTVKRDVTYKDINLSKIISDYKLPLDSYICFSSSDEIAVRGEDASGNTVRQTISNDVIQRKYIVTRTEPYYIWREEEEAYWRKNWDLVEWLDYTTKKPIENTEYRRLNATLIRRINSKFGSCVSAESATKESAMFYWHWY